VCYVFLFCDYFFQFYLLYGQICCDIFLTWFQIFHTPEGTLSTEQGVYVAESVSAKNTKQAKGRFRMYDDEDDVVHFNFFFFIAPFMIFS